MAIRRYTLATDNMPATGYVEIDDISGSGDFHVEIGWTPQAATVSLAKYYNLPSEYIPSSGTLLYELEQDAPSSLTYDIKEVDTFVTPSTTTISSIYFTDIFYVSSIYKMISRQAWNLYTSSSGAADKIQFQVKEFDSVSTLWAMVHPEVQIEGDLRYFGAGTDVSASWGLAPRTKIQLVSGISESDDIAEIVFVNGAQIIGDTYDEYYYEGQGAYDLTIENNILYCTFREVPGADDPYYFAIFDKRPEPELRIRFENAPFSDGPNGEKGMWLIYKNIPKGILRFNYYVR